MYLSIIIPAFKEASRITPTLETVHAYLKGQSYESEVIVVDDGSPDNTAEIVQKECLRFQTEASSVSIRMLELGTNIGKGAAVQAGMLAATGTIRIFTDADLSTPIYEIAKVISAIENECFDVVIGSRALEDSALVKVHQPWYRETMGKMFNIFVQIFVFSGIKDTQCGFKGFRAEAAKTLFKKQQVMGFSFDVEILYLAKKLDYKIKEVAVEWYNDERTTVGALSDSTRMFLEILRIKRLHRGEAKG